MLFWIFVILLALGIIGLVLYENGFVAWEWVGAIGNVLTVLFSGAVIVSLFFMCCSLTTPEATSAYYEQRYDFLVYQYQNDIYENDLGKRELMSDIQSWNEDIAMKREIQDNFWVGIYVPDIYDNFEFIELDKSPIARPSA